MMVIYLERFITFTFLGYIKLIMIFFSFLKRIPIDLASRDFIN